MTVLRSTRRLPAGALIYKHARALGCEGIVSERLGAPYRSDRSNDWIKVKNPAAPAVKREADRIGRETHGFGK